MKRLRCPLHLKVMTIFVPLYSFYSPCLTEKEFCTLIKLRVILTSDIARIRCERWVFTFSTLRPSYPYSYFFPFQFMQTIVTDDT